MLPSACFEVLVNAEGQIVLRGGGNGHGIGMSQYGARGMATEAFGQLYSCNRRSEQCIFMAANSVYALVDPLVHNRC